MTPHTTAAQTGTTVVIGAGSKTGRRVSERLMAAGMRLRPASRSTATGFDWEDPGTWDTALTGVAAVYITYHPDLALPGAADTIGAFADLAVARGVRRLILLSGRGEAGARAAERRVQTSGADWTILRCASFNQNFEDLLREAVRHGVLAMPGGQTLEPFVDAEDIADVVYAALTDDRHLGQLYELTGPRLMTLADVATELSAAVGRAVGYAPVTPAGFAQALTAQGLPGDLSDSIAQLVAEVLDGRNAYLSDGVQRALGRPPRDFRDYARATAAAGVWDRDEVAA
ncbi:NAD(P)H-binding protein [Thiorhodococcus mannitoliphagus]|uniref:NAD(P)H-binding protein n=1 Tax=Thiorhodococcus mannitoliphagus TaxID=329406 RepID=A0A6P1DSA5_9GAMM|nr:NAD(P)H-binding protein [Thiorhodococcus mannitoliphagus]NEX20948.1 NAD(P)H-binding protein [Thiorhodococcus mannitoliphagus]